MVLGGEVGDLVVMLGGWIVWWFGLCGMGLGWWRGGARGRSSSSTGRTHLLLDPVDGLVLLHAGGRGLLGRGWVGGR